MIQIRSLSLTLFNIIGLVHLSASLQSSIAFYDQEFNLNAAESLLTKWYKKGQVLLVFFYSEV